jgi:multicomponent Na+:H+ antiporter subunit A
MLLSLFMVAMIGCVTADNLILLFIFWEATSVLSFLLVGFEHARAESRRSAQQALLVTGTGGLALLAGFILLAQQMGTASLSTIVETLPAATPTAELTLALLLILVGAFTKSAQFPFPLLASECHVGPHAGVGVPAFGHHGEAGRLPAGAA